jgi:hypothetical protein
MNNVNQYEWAACIISSRENYRTIASTLKATYSACANKSAIIDIVINGNLELTNELKNKLGLQDTCDTESAKIRLWFIEESDKANALNQYLHRIWPGSGLTFFVDGYAQPWPDAFQEIDNKLVHNDFALAASAVPTDGNSAKYLRKLMISEGGIHGNLFAIKSETLLKMREIHFNLPKGIYRTDSTIAAAMGFNFDPRINSWNIKERVIVVPGASWSLPKEFKISPLNIFNKIIAFIKRKARQAQGNLENLAVKEHFSILKKKPEDLPETVNMLINNWLKNNKKYSTFYLLSHPLAVYAYVKIKSNHSGTEKMPECLAEGYIHKIQAE